MQRLARGSSSGNAAAGSYLRLPSFPLSLSKLSCWDHLGTFSLSLSPSAALSRGNNCCLVDTFLPFFLLSLLLFSSFLSLFPAERERERERERGVRERERERLYLSSGYFPLLTALPHSLPLLQTLCHPKGDIGSGCCKIHGCLSGLRRDASPRHLCKKPKATSCD